MAFPSLTIIFSLLAAIEAGVMCCAGTAVYALLQMRGKKPTELPRLSSEYQKRKAKSVD